MSVISLVLLLLFLVMIVLGVMTKEYRTSGFWFKALVGVAVLLSFGGFSFLA